MPHRLVTLVLAPFLILQGRSVRRKALILPEPPGDRQGRQGAGPVLRLLIVGDSSAAGVGAPHQQEALSGQLVAALAEQVDVHWRLVAKTGATTESTLRALDRIEAQEFDVAVIALGVNDVTSNVAVRTWLRQQSALFDLLFTRFGLRRIYASGFPPVGRFPLLPHPLRWVLGRKAREHDRALQQLVAGADNIRHVPLAETLSTDQMAEDGFHPGPEVYRTWGQGTAQVILSDLWDMGF